MRKISYPDQDICTRKRSSGYLATIQAAILLILSIFILNRCTKSGNYDESIGDPLKTKLALIIPSNLADSVYVDPVISVTFKDGTDRSIIKSSAITLKKGTEIVEGVTTYSENTATFLAAGELSENNEYTATITAEKGIENPAMREYSWKFRTGRSHSYNSLVVSSVLPFNKAVSVPVDSSVKVNFNKELTSNMQNVIAVTLKNGSSDVAGVLKYNGKIATFKPNSSLLPNSLYVGNVSIGPKTAGSSSAYNYTWSFTTAGEGADVTAPVVSSVVPANNAVSVLTGTSPKVTFSEVMNPATLSTSTFTLKQGTTSVQGVVSADGTTATFTPASPLTANKVYTATITTGARDAAGNALASAYVWSFTTESGTDNTAPTVLSVVPASGSTGVSATTKANVTFSEAMNPATISSASISLKQGTTTIAGTVTLSGATATFTPTAALAANTVYTGTVTTAVKDVAGNALAANYTWSFTTATISDVTPPTVTTVVPANNATSIALNSKATVTFSEVMTASTLTSSTFTLKQGSTAVAGVVSYTGSTATFTPSAALSGGTVYTATITTGAKDLAGNAVASNYSWSFTTVATATGKSFANDVMPILGICNTCHTHPWTTSTDASTFYTNLVNGGYVNPSSPTTSKIYTKLSGGHPNSTVTTAQVNTILTWMTEGSKNN